jgi:Tfp pilus assembly protein PilF
MKKSVLLGLLILLKAGIACSQGNLIMPQSSQNAGVTQRIGLTDISISYSSPLVKGRLIWGELVPFGEVWRAGANENTVITFSTPVSIEGKSLPAGTYGLHMIPRKDTWTIIFSSNSKSWGSYFYNAAEDVLRVEVRPESTSMQEWLSYRFTDPKHSSVKVMMNWEKIGVGFLVQIDVPQTVLESMRQELRGPKYYTWEGPYAAADYCLKNKVNLEEAMVWVDHSIQLKETFTNLNVKAGLLQLKGDAAAAQKYKSKAVSVADEQQLNAYGYQLLAEGKKQAAIDIFKLNVKRNPDSWNVYDSLGDAYEQNSNWKEAYSNYKIALSKAPEAQKKRITTSMEKIQKKM